MTEFYSPGNLDHILSLLTFTPQWLLLGGPSDGCEAQRARELWPRIRIVGVEPNRSAVAFQRANGWPADAPLLRAALSTWMLPVWIKDDGIRNSTADTASAGPGEHVPGVKWDWLDAALGPFEDAICWMDIERSELAALHGAMDLLNSRRVGLWNLELQGSLMGAYVTETDNLMRQHGYYGVHDWNASDACRDRVYVRR